MTPPAPGPRVDLVGVHHGRKPSLRTTARVLYDDQNLYLALDCEDPDAWGNLKKHDDPIYTEEVVEVFLDANVDGKVRSSSRSRRTTSPSMPASPPAARIWRRRWPGNCWRPR